MIGHIYCQRHKGPRECVLGWAWRLGKLTRSDRLKAKKTIHLFHLVFVAWGQPASARLRDHSRPEARKGSMVWTTWSSRYYDSDGCYDIMMVIKVDGCYGLVAMRWRVVMTLRKHLPQPTSVIAMWMVSKEASCLKEKHIFSILIDFQTLPTFRVSETWSSWSGKEPLSCLNNLVK